MNSDDTSPSTFDHPPKKQWVTPTCTDLDELEVEGGGGLSDENFDGVPPS